MTNTFLITSAAFVSQEFVAELGRLPPAFLPLGNKRIFQHQHELISQLNGRRIISLPAAFDIPEWDALLLRELEFEIVYVPSGLSLGDSILFALDDTMVHEGSLRVLHGDTLISDFDLTCLDSFAVGSADTYYPWAEYFIGDDGKTQFLDGLHDNSARPVVAGYFSFSKMPLFKQSLARARGSFINALNRYAAEEAMEPKRAQGWHDLGHLHTYHRSRASMTTERAFNRLTATQHVVTKASEHDKKIALEARWYNDLPAPLRRYTPHRVDTAGSVPNGYAVEYLFLSTLSELNVFGRLPPIVWEKIFDSCDRWLHDCANFAAPVDVLQSSVALYLPKTLARLEEFEKTSGVDMEMSWRLNGRRVPGLREIAEAVATAIERPSDAWLGVVHGDFCFSNIFYDFRAHTIKVVDPRGGDGVFGDLRYDIAKLYHSAVAGYDFIIASRYHCRSGGCSSDLEFDIAPPREAGAVAALFREREWLN